MIDRNHWKVTLFGSIVSHWIAKGPEFQRFTQNVCSYACIFCFQSCIYIQGLLHLAKIGVQWSLPDPQGCFCEQCIHWHLIFLIEFFPTWILALSLFVDNIWAFILTKVLDKHITCHSILHVPNSALRRNTLCGIVNTLSPRVRVWICCSTRNRCTKMLTKNISLALFG